MPLLLRIRVSHAGGDAGARKRNDAELLRDLRVLIADDAADELDLLTVVLQLCGALVAAARTVEEVKDAFLQHQPHVVMTDIAMPNDRFGLIQAVRAQTSAPERRWPPPSR